MANDQIDLDGSTDESKCTMASKRVSIIINNYNYCKFVGLAITSAINQTHPNTEVLVVDDGSTDDSVHEILRFSGEVTPILKSNGGMASNYNVAVPRCRGEVVIMLDADDVLLPTAAATAAEMFGDPAVVQVHWPMLVVNGSGKPSGALVPDKPLADGDLRRDVIDRGPWSHMSTFTSGIAWRRRYLDAVLPIPELQYRRGSEGYLVTLAPLFGKLRRVESPQSLYRVHGHNDYSGRPLSDRLRLDLEMYTSHCSALSRRLAREGVHADSSNWRKNNAYVGWLETLDKVCDVLIRALPHGAIAILIDDNQMGTYEISQTFSMLPFTERGGQYWGLPMDGCEAVRELERMRSEGAEFVCIAQTSFWWFEHYRELAEHLNHQYRCIVNDETIRVFEMRYRRGDGEQ